MSASERMMKLTNCFMKPDTDILLITERLNLRQVLLCR